jgi:hypothetical protein
MKIRINHPMADMISIVDHTFAYAGPSSVELAFFNKGDWVVKPIPEFAEYHDGTPEDHDTAVYPYVPRNLVDDFISQWQH